MDITSVPPEEELNQLLKETFTSYFRTGYIAVNDFTLPESYPKFEKVIKEFEVFDTDLWICGFPKTGTTWISEIAWLIFNDLDYERAKEISLSRTKLFEFSLLFHNIKQGMFPSLDAQTVAMVLDSFSGIVTQKGPRSIKSHLPFSLLPDQIQNGTRKPRIICIARNPMDTCVSYYYQCKNYENYTGTLEEFCKLFLFDKINYGPYSKHVLSFWEQRFKRNMLFLTYEEMKNDLPGVIQKVASFLGKTLSEEDSVRLQKHVSFESMSTNSAVNKEGINKVYEAGGQIMTPFIRVGKVGTYRSAMSSEIIAKFRYWVIKRFEGSGLNLLD